jgi:hypothetical protein
MVRIRDPGSEIREKNHPGSQIRIPDPWGKKAPDPGSRIRIRNTVFHEASLVSLVMYI